jgi:hypothetical protein
MNQKSTPINTVAQIALLVILGLAIVFAITTLRGTTPSRLSSTQGTTPEGTGSVTPGPDETQTVAAIITFKAIVGTTEAARTSIPQTPIILATGIYEDEPVKQSGKLLGLDAQNGWSGSVDGYHFFIYAGALLSDPEQGVIVMVTTKPSGTSIDQFETSTQHGALRAVSEQNNRLTLIATDGTVFYFDLPTRQFVASLTEVAPSVTPSLTPSPSATPEPTGLPYPLPTEPNTVVP